MRTNLEFFCPLVLAAVVGAMAGCTRSNSGPGPSDGNLAPLSQSEPPPNETAPQSYQEPYEEPPAASEQLAVAPQPPPPLPVYDQPPCPGANYIWTPGYWAYGEAGYYWVPGAWVVAPYVDALWTPPYWAYADGRYDWHAGYWGRYIGFYGGINYGFGYTGLGFYGGYWRDGRFVYNRAVANVNTRVVRDYYRRAVTNYTPLNRVSYNGGPGGVNRAPGRAEMAMRNESRIGPLPAQTQHMREAAMNRGQFARENGGRPAMAAAGRPLAVPYRAPAPAPEAWRQGAAHPGNPARPEGPAAGRGPGEASRTMERPPARPEMRQPAQGFRPEAPHATEQGRGGQPPMRFGEAGRGEARPAAGPAPARAMEQGRGGGPPQGHFGGPGRGAPGPPAAARPAPGPEPHGGGAAPQGQKPEEQHGRHER